MKVVVVTGHSASGIETVWDLMRSFDIAAPAPAQSETDDPAVFHHKLFRARDVGLADAPGQIKPGRMWQSRAENLLINNVESHVWGWGEVRSSRLLDFWAGVDQCTHSVLIYVPPEVTLAMAPTTAMGAKENSEDTLASWRLKNSELLDFYSRHRDRSLLLNTYSLIARPHRLRELLADRFGIDLPNAEQERIACIDFPVSAMRSFLARTLLEDTEAIALYQELETASDLPADPDYYQHEAARAWSEHVRLVDAQAQLEVALSEANQLQHVLENTQRELDATRGQLKQAETRVKTSEQAQSQLREQIAALQKDLSKTQQTAEKQSKELETYYLRVQETDSKLRQQAQELKTEQARSKDRENKAGDAQKALEKAQRELDGTRGQLKQAETRAKTSEQAQSQLREQIAALQKDLGKTQQTANEQSKENELLLLQLHQVQEELENYYLKYKEIQGAQQKQPTATPTTPHKLVANNGNDTPVDKAGFVRSYLNKRKTARKLRRKISVIRKSGLFDEQWYLKAYSDVARSGMDPIRHYLKFGAEEGRDPSLKFDTRYYQHTNPDVARLSVNPLIHYISHGKAEGRRPRAA